MTTEQPAHVKVTINDLYREQQETNKLLIQLATELKSLSDLPDRVSKLEIANATTAWVPKLMWAALTAGVSSIIATIWQAVAK